MYSKIFASRAVVPLGLAGIAAMRNTTKCSGEDCIPSLDYGWTQQGLYSSMDYASVRRGFQVYRQVCAACHSMKYLAFRELVGVTHTEEGAKAVAKSYDIQDGPDDTGEMFTRPGKLFDYFPSPYANEEQGRAANNGAYPPDLSLMALARHAGKDYIVSLLTGYVDAPAGKPMLPGLHYNPYFSGGAIAMPKPLNDGQIEYEDGTPATLSQMAYDVANFLDWGASPEADERKKNGLQLAIMLFAGMLLAGYAKRVKWSPIKSRRVTYTDKYHFKHPTKKFDN